MRAGRLWMVTAMLAVAGCAFGPSPSPSSEPSGVPVLRRFPIWRNVGGVEVGCDAVGVADPVRGTLEGDPTTSGDPVWLRSGDGRDMAIIWPEGFWATFTPDLTLFDEDGVAVARAGDTVVLQVSSTAAAGTFEDPYFASGIMSAGPNIDPDDGSGATYQGCFPRRT